MLDLARYPDYGTIGEALRDLLTTPTGRPRHGGAHPAAGRPGDRQGRAQTFDTGTANEFPRINPAIPPARYRYAYIAGNPRPARGPGLQQRVTRIDTRPAGRLARFRSRAVIPASRSSSQPGPAAPEDDGVVLVTLVFDAAARTDIVGLDARDLAAAPLFVAPAETSRAFPLHGTFTPRLF